MSTTTESAEVAGGTVRPGQDAEGPDRAATEPMGVVGDETPGRQGPASRLRAGARRRPVATGVLVAALAAGAAFGGGFAVGRVTAPGATLGTVLPQDRFGRVPGDGGAPPDGFARDGFGPGGPADGGTTDGGTTDGGTGTDGSTDGGSDGVQDGGST